MTALCYQCRKPKGKTKSPFCKECKNKPREKGTSTLIIYHTV